MMMKQLVCYAVAGIVLLCLPWQVAAIEVAAIDHAGQLVELILGAGMTVLPDSIEYRGSPNAVGIFTDGISSGLGIDSGIVLSTGDVISDSGASPGSENSNNSVLWGTSVLEFDVELADQDGLCFRFIFASEEYDGTVADWFTDVVALYVDGKNAAFIPGTTIPVSVRTVNAQTNKQYFLDNRPQPDTGVSPYNIGYSGLTTMLSARVSELAPGIHHVKAIITNIDDTTRDSAIFIGAKTLSNQLLPLLTITDATGSEQSGTLLFTVSLSEASDQEVSVNFETLDGTAFAGEDFEATEGTLTFPEGEMSQTIEVTLIENLNNENQEMLYVMLSKPDNAILGDDRGQGTILADVQPTPSPTPDPQVIPEPGTLILVVLGLLSGLALIWRRRRKF